MGHCLTHYFQPITLLHYFISQMDLSRWVSPPDKDEQINTIQFNKLILLL